MYWVLIILFLIGLYQILAQDSSGDILAAESVLEKEFTDHFADLKGMFQAPSSDTKIKTKCKSNRWVAGQCAEKRNKSEDAYLDPNWKPDSDQFKHLISLLEEASENQAEISGNVMSYPKYFECREKWEGCIPSPLFQGNCGSCWAFAAVTCLSARFCIESCGNTGCQHIPQMDLKSVDDAAMELNKIYKFRKITLQGVFRSVDQNLDTRIDQAEWEKSALEMAKKAETLKGFRKYTAIQSLIYMLDFPELGSLDLRDIEEVKKRAKSTFEIWRKKSGDDKFMTVKDWENDWYTRPIPLSVEKLIACCHPDCYKNEIPIDGENWDPSRDKLKIRNNPVCLGGSLTKAWRLLRDGGTTTAMCLGYNLDRWEEGDETPSCQELQGPNYSYCSSYSLKNESTEGIHEAIAALESSGLDPIVPSNDQLPWISPQFYRFKARNAYELEDSVSALQLEIIERGPITTGFMVYPDFQFEFGGTGRGGQLYKKGSQALGSKKDSLIYMWNGKGDPLGGHAITVTGWGSFKDPILNVEIPYWICLNSWGRVWGSCGYTAPDNRSGPPPDMTEGGYFWILRGFNHCQFEENAVAGQPNLENIIYPKTADKYGWGLPPPEMQNIQLIPPFENNVVNVKGWGSFKFHPYGVPGGGMYNSRLATDSWAQKSMRPPSPYTLFWPKTRPIYVLDKLKQDLKGDVSDNIVEVTKEAHDKICRALHFEQNPLFVIGKEQLQIAKVFPPCQHLNDYSSTNPVDDLIEDTPKPVKKPSGTDLRESQYRQGVNKMSCIDSAEGVFGKSCTQHYNEGSCTGQDFSLVVQRACPGSCDEMCSAEKFKSIKIPVDTVKTPVSESSNESLPIPSKLARQMNLLTKHTHDPTREPYIVVERGLNHSFTHGHKTGEIMQMFPFRDLSVPDLANCVMEGKCKANKSHSPHNAPSKKPV